MKVFRISPVGKRMLAVSGELADMIEDIEQLVSEGEVILIAADLDDPLQHFEDVEDVDATNITEDDDEQEDDS